MSVEHGGPSEAEMNFKAEGPRLKSEYTNPNSERLVQKTLALAEQLGGNKLRPELVQAVGEAIDLKDPAAMDALDPDSVRNQKHLSTQARDNLRRAWDVIEGASGRAGVK
jgi:hypothetical protein